MTLQVGESITSIQLNVSELQKQCAGFKVELDCVVNLAKQIQADASVLIDEWEGQDETSNRRANQRPILGGVAVRPTCGSCRYFNLLGGDGTDAWMGECRRRSPELLVDIEGNLSPAWPPVDEIHWCGDYSPDNYS
jgi:hypothetical protein